jgi:predicted nucleic acid-binding protein
MVIPGVSHLFVDTNILVFATDASSPFESAAETELGEWRKQGTDLYISVQVLREYLAVTTRLAPTQNTPPDYPAILGNMASFRSAFHVLEDTRLVSEKLGELVQRFGVKGRQVHDASIAATMLTHGLQHLLTHN